MTQLGYTKSERDIAHLMSQHETERMVLEAQWRGEINHLQMQQRKGYRQWMDGVYEEMMASGGRGFLARECGVVLMYLCFLFVCLFVCLFWCLFLCFVCVFVCFCVFVFVCLFVSLFFVFLLFVSLFVWLLTFLTLLII